MLDIEATDRSDRVTDANDLVLLCKEECLSPDREPSSRQTDHLSYLADRRPWLQSDLFRCEATDRHTEGTREA